MEDGDNECQSWARTPLQLLGLGFILLKFLLQTFHQDVRPTGALGNCPQNIHKEWMYTAQGVHYGAAQVSPQGRTIAPAAGVSSELPWSGRAKCASDKDSLTPRES